MDQQMDTNLVLTDALNILQGMVRALDAHEQALHACDERTAPHRMAAVSEVRRQMAAAAASARDVIAHLPDGRNVSGAWRAPARIDRRGGERRAEMLLEAPHDRRGTDRRQGAERREWSAPAHSRRSS